MTLTTSRWQGQLEQVRRFWAGHGRWAASITPTAIRAAQTADDAARRHAAVEGLRQQQDWPGWNLPSFFPDYGTVSQAIHFGGTVRVSDAGLPYIEPAVTTMDQALALKPRPFDDPELHVAQATRMYHELRQAGVGDGELWYRTVDTQGPMNTAGQILQQEELLMAMHDDGSRAAAFLERITEFCIALWQWQRQQAEGRVCGSIWPYTFLPPEVGVSFTEDMMPLLSPEIYERFGIPLLRRVQQEFAGLHIHCCGKWGHHVPTLLGSGLRIVAMEFHHPYTTIDELIPLAEAGTVLVPYIAMEKQQRYRSVWEYYRDLLARTSSRVRFWFCLHEPADEAIAFYREMEQSGW